MNSFFAPLLVVSLLATTAQAQSGAPPTEAAPPRPVAAATPPARNAAAPTATAPTSAAAEVAASPATYSAEMAQTPPTADSGGTSGSYGQAPVPDAHVGLFANSLGVLQFGLTPTVEYGSRVAVNARVLLVNTGVLSYVAAGDDTLHFSAGVGPGLRYYFGSDGNLRGAYLGGFGLYLPWEEQYEEETRYNTTMLVVGAEGGYRWVFNSGFLLGVGAMGGYAAVLDESSTSLDGTTPDGNHATDRPFGMLTLDLGVVI